MTKKMHVGLSLGLVLLTIGAFAYYLSKHRYLLTNLRHVPLSTIVWVLLLYGAILGVLVLILGISLALCRKRMGVKENFLLNGYGLFANFFMPGQSGPAVRGLYLKKRHQLKVRDYIFVSLVYYAVYAVLSAGLLLVCSRPWWWTVLGVAATAGFSLLVLHLYTKRSKRDEGSFDLRPRLLLFFMAATAAQCLLQVAIYGVELQAVNPHIGLAQTVTYTGAANFALFVSLTPGAIGIRESFLLFSERLHHISSANVVAANVIDRGVYLIFLGILFVLTLALHAKTSLGLKRLQEAPKPIE